MRFPFLVKSPLRVGLTALLATVLHANAAAQTSVTITFHGPLREPVSMTRAQLLVTAWGVVEEYDLPVQGDVLHLDLEATRPEFADRFADESGYLYIKAEGYAPLISQAFTWPAENQPTVIDFRDGRTVTIAPGSAATLDVTLRKPLARRIRLVDGVNRPVAGIGVQIAVNWNTPNHCGFLNGMDVLARGVTNGAGVLDVPDVDGNYAFILLTDRRMVFADADSTFPPGGRHGFVTSLTGLDTTVRIRRFQRQRLALDIVNNGKPVSGAVLWAGKDLGVCGAGYGPLATSDARGHIQVEDFYPEEWRSFWLCSGGKQVWFTPDDGELPAKIDVSAGRTAELKGRVDRCAR